MITTDSGLIYEDIKVGEGQEATTGDSVVVHYTGWLVDGRQFESSKNPGREPFEFNLGAQMVIRGWDEVVQGMKIGGIRKLTIPPALGYGSRPIGPIPANSTLNFEVELLGIK